jgi:hypothetical protein
MLPIQLYAGGGVPTTTKPYTASELRQELRKMGLRDDQMLFSDSPDGKGIIPWGFVDEAGKFQASASHSTALVPQAELCAPDNKSDNLK